MKKKLDVLVLMEEVNIPKEDLEFRAGHHEKSMEYDVVSALRKLGHQVRILGIFDRVEPLVQSLAENRPDIVFNLIEQFNNERRFDKNIAGVLELMGIPFTGTGSGGLMLCRNKGLCKQLLSTRKIRVPGFAVFPPGKAIRLPKSLTFPLVVKPLYADGSEGISNASLVKTTEELADRARLVHERWNQPAIVEEYIEGREIYIGVLGNRRLWVLPSYELHFGKEADGGPVLATYRVKWNKKYQDKWHIKFGLSDINGGVAKNMARVCRKVFRLLQLQDYARIDLRLTPDNRIVILEANPNPDISFGEEISEAAKKAGLDYIQLIDRIVRMAMGRNCLPD